MLSVRMHKVPDENPVQPPDNVPVPDHEPPVREPDPVTIPPIKDPPAHPQTSA
jgi:hypothetical protein